jgi:hypothetical protein
MRVCARNPLQERTSAMIQDKLHAGREGVRRCWRPLRRHARPSRERKERSSWAVRVLSMRKSLQLSARDRVDAMIWGTSTQLSEPLLFAAWVEWTARRRPERRARAARGRGVRGGRAHLGRIQRRRRRPVFCLAWVETKSFLGGCDRENCGSVIVKRGPKYKNVITIRVSRPCL